MLDANKYDYLFPYIIDLRISCNQMVERTRHQHTCLKLHNERKGFSRVLLSQLMLQICSKHIYNVEMKVSSYFARKRIMIDLDRDRFESRENLLNENNSNKYSVFVVQVFFFDKHIRSV